MWEVPMTAIKDIRGGTCAMADGCYYDEDAASIQKIFTQNFLEHYTKSKAPFPLFFHSAWFFNRVHRQEGFFKFIDSILALPDVYFVTSQELISKLLYLGTDVVNTLCDLDTHGWNARIFLYPSKIVMDRTRFNVWSFIAKNMVFEFEYQ